MKIDEKSLREMMREEINAALNTKRLPQGHTKCATCGEIYKVDYGKCPYCELKVRDAKPPVDDEDDGSITIL